MDVEKAVSQISDIHRHLAKSEVFYGYRPKPVFSVGIIALIVAALQTWLIIPSSDLFFLLQWISVAAVVLFIMGGNIVYNYSISASNYELNQMSKVFIQFVPSLLAGSIITAVFIVLDSSAIVFLPGIWAVMFGLGIFSMRPYLPRMIGWISLFYILAGGSLMYLVRYDIIFNPWGMGLTFGIGHILAAIILHLDIERNVK